MNKREVGSKYEQLAVKYLEDRGMQIVEVNYRRKTGEIDLIGRDEDYLVFVEVKYRKSRQAGGAMYAISAAKQKKIVRTASYYCLENHIPSNWPIRFDAVLIDGDSVTHIENAWQER